MSSFSEDDDELLQVAKGLSGDSSAAHLTEGCCQPQLELPISWCGVRSWLSAALPCLQVGGAVLCSLTVAGCLRAQSTVRGMKLVSIRRMLSLQQLVSASLPSDAQPSWLSSLQLSRSKLSRIAVQGCSFLGHLTSLEMFSCTFKGVHAAAVTKAMLQQALRLRRLTLLACFRQQPLPPALLSRTGLLHLNLLHNRLAHLPPGRYLSSE